VASRPAAEVDSPDRGTEEDAEDAVDDSCFVKLMDGTEGAEWVRKRAELFHKQWGTVEKRIKVRLGHEMATGIILNTFAANPQACQSGDS
jgi:hypothetical protein